MRRLGIALTTTALLLAACSGTEEPEDPTTDTTSTAADPAGETSSPGPGGDATTTDTDDGTDSAEPSTAPGTDGDDSTTGVEATADSPGEDTALDRPSEEILTEAGILTNGVIAFGPVGPEDPEVNLAMCDHVFGTPEQVAAAAGVEGEVALAPESGYLQNGGGGNGLQCLYVVDGVEAFGLAVWSQALEVDGAAAEALLVQTQLASGDHGFVVVNPEWESGLALDEAGAIAWLEDAGTRWDGASV